MAANFPQLPPQGGDARGMSTVVNLAMRGKLNATTVLTLEPGAGSTTLNDERIGPDSFIGLSPLSASAAAAHATTYIASRGRGTARIDHASSAAADRMFSVLIIG